MTDPYSQRPSDSAQSSPAAQPSPSAQSSPSAQPSPSAQSSPSGQSSPPAQASYSAQQAYSGQPSDQGRGFDQAGQQYGAQQYGGQQQFGTQQYGEQQYGAQYGGVAQYPGASADPWQQGGAFPVPGDAPVGSPKSNVGWAVATLIFFWPLAFSAFTHALDVYPSWAAGDVPRAAYHSQRARTLGLWSIAIAAILFVLGGLLYVVAIVAMVDAVSSSTSTW